MRLDETYGRKVTGDMIDQAIRDYIKVMHRQIHKMVFDNEDDEALNALANIGEPDLLYVIDVNQMSINNFTKFMMHYGRPYSPIERLDLPNAPLSEG